MLTIGGQPQYSAGDTFPDGVYYITYNYLTGSTVTASYQVTAVIIGDIIIDGNLSFIHSPNVWDKSEMDITSDVTIKLLEPLRKYSLRKAIYSQPYQNSITKIVNTIQLLTNLINNLQQ
jgi:hypothetical protein